MPHRIGKLFSVVLLTLTLTLGAAANKGGAPRIVAIGDLHGNYDAFRAIVAAAGLTDGRGRWTGGDAVLVQVGDVADRGPDSLKIIMDMMRLQREARRTRGRVIALVGNHEAMNMTGDLRYVHPGEFAAFADSTSASRRERVFEANKAAIAHSYRSRDPAITGTAIRDAWFNATPLGKLEHQVAWSPNGKIGRWVTNNPAVVMLQGSLFVHGGLSHKYRALPIEEINRRTAEALAAQETADESIINDPLGPLWYRGLAKRIPGEGPDEARVETLEAEFEAVLRSYGAQRVVIGHTPAPKGITMLHEGRVIQIDTAMAPPYGGPWTYLEIRDGKVNSHIVAEGARRSQQGAGNEVEH